MSAAPPSPTATSGVDTILVPCPHAAHGCAERLKYHDRESHAQTCAHKSCHCPGEGCSFAGAVQTTLLEHFASVHGWPCSAGSIGPSFCVRLRKGFNVVSVYTLVLIVEQPAPVCDAITAFCIHPSHTGTLRCRISYYRQRRRERHSDLFSNYLQSSNLEVMCTDLSNGMPRPSSCFPLLLPRWSAAGGGDDDDILVVLDYIGSI